MDITTEAPENTIITTVIRLTNIPTAFALIIMTTKPLAESLLKSAVDFKSSDNNYVIDALRDFAKQCLLFQLAKGGIAQDVYNSLSSEIEDI